MYHVRRILVAEADVTLDDGPHFLRRLLARTHGFLRQSGSAIHVPQVTRSRFNSLPVVLPLPSALPAAAACAPQSAFGHTNHQELRHPRTLDVFLS